MSHTPGPWTVGSIKGTVYKDGTFLARAESGEHVEWLRGNPFASGVCEANARLIAAAPDLLEAAKAVLAWADSCDPVDSFGTEETGSWLSFTGQQTLDGLRAAISKAEGK